MNICLFWGRTEAIDAYFAGNLNEDRYANRILSTDPVCVAKPSFPFCYSTKIKINHRKFKSETNGRYVGVCRTTIRHPCMENSLVISLFCEAYSHDKYALRFSLKTEGSTQKMHTKIKSNKNQKLLNPRIDQNRQDKAASPPIESGRRIWSPRSGGFCNSHLPPT